MTAPTPGETAYNVYWPALSPGPPLQSPPPVAWERLMPAVQRAWEAAAQAAIAAWWQAHEAAILGPEEDAGA